jgi:arsenate reductase (thioredoxin)
MEDKKIIFVCEHGAAKSILAAALFNKLAGDGNLNVRAIARGTNPDVQLSPKTIAGLQADGLTATESTPQKLSRTDIESAERAIAFCELPEEFQNEIIVDQWDDIPAVSEDYVKARDMIIEHLNRLMNDLQHL